MNRIELFCGHLDLAARRLRWRNLGVVGALGIGLAASESLPSIPRISLVAGAALVGLYECCKRVRGFRAERNVEALSRAMREDDTPRALDILHRFSPKDIPWDYLIREELPRLVKDGHMEGARVILHKVPYQWQYKVEDSLYRERSERFEIERATAGGDLDRRAIWLMPWSSNNNTTGLGIAIWVSGHIKDYEKQAIRIIDELPVAALQVPCSAESTPLEYASQCGASEVFFAIREKLPSDVREAIPGDIVLMHTRLEPNLVQFLRNRETGLSSRTKIPRARDSRADNKMINRNVDDAGY